MVDEGVVIVRTHRGGRWWERSLRHSALQAPRDALLTFLVLATVFISFFIVFKPAGWGLDEEVHTARAYQVSEGILTPFVRADGQTLGAFIPQSLYDLEMNGNASGNVIDRNAPGWQRADLPDPVRVDELFAQPLGDDTVEFEMSNAAASSFLAYTPAAIGFAIGKIFDVSVGWDLVLAQIFNGLFFLLVVSIAVLVTGRSPFRWLVVLVALLPETIFQASYITADTYTNAMSLLFVAVVLRLLTAETKRPLLALGLLLIGAIGVVSAKPTYAILLALILLIPASRLIPASWHGPSRATMLRRGWLAKLSVLAVSGAVALLILYSTRSVAAAIAARYARGADPTEQDLGPAHLFGVLVRTTLQWGEEWVRGLVGVLGYTTVGVPQPFGILLIAAIILAAYIPNRISRTSALVLVAVAVITGAAAIIAIYISFSPVGLEVSDGVQGRYFTPLLIPLVVGVATLLPGKFQISKGGSLVLFGGVSASALIATAFNWLYYLY